MGTFNLLVFDPEQAVARSVVNILEDWHASAWLSDYGLVSLAEITAHGANLADLAVRLTGCRRARQRVLAGCGCWTSEMAERSV